MTQLPSVFKEFLPGVYYPSTHHHRQSQEPLIFGTRRANGIKPVLQPYSPAPPVGALPHTLLDTSDRIQTYSGSYYGTIEFSLIDY